jgi:hypothetical protein
MHELFLLLGFCSVPPINPAFSAQKNARYVPRVAELSVLATQLVDSMKPISRCERYVVVSPQGVD